MFYYYSVTHQQSMLHKIQ